MSKIWLADPATDTYGGIYLFTDASSIESYLNTEIVSSIKANPRFTNVIMRSVGTIEEETNVTGGPLTTSADLARVGIESSQDGEHLRGSGRTCKDDVQLATPAPRPTSGPGPSTQYWSIWNRHDRKQEESITMYHELVSVLLLRGLEQERMRRFRQRDQLSALATDITTEWNWRSPATLTWKRRESAGMRRRGLVFLPWMRAMQTAGARV